MNGFVFSPRNQKNLHLTLIVLCLFTLYSFTMPLTVTLEDAGAFILAARTGGIAHPPGYPLYVMMGWFFSLLPFGEPALPLHLLSALFAALACGSLYLVGRELNFSASASLFAALLYGCSNTFWSQAIIAEVYALNAFFFFTLFFLSLRLASLPETEEREMKKTLALFVFLFALSLTNHYPLILLAAPALFFPLLGRWRTFFREWKIALPLFLAGLSPYLFLLIRSRFNPYIAAFGPVESLNDLLWYIFRQQYGGVDADPFAGIGDRFRFALYFFRHLALEFSPAGILFIPVGFVLAWRRLSRRIALALLLAFLSASLLLLLFLSRDYDLLRREAYLVYQLIPFGVAALLGGLFLNELDKILTAKFRLKNIGFLLLPGALLLSAALVWNLGDNNRHRDRFASEYASLVLESLPREAILFASGDADIGPLGYAHLLRGVRRDVTLYSQYGFLFGNRLFNERHDSVQTAARRIAGLLDRRGELYFVTPAPVLLRALRRERSFTTENLGIYVRLHTDPASTSQFEANILRGYGDLLEREAGKGGRWVYHRRIIRTEICQLLLTRGLWREAFLREPGCRFLQAKKLAAAGANERAARLLGELLADESELPRREKYEIALHYLLVRLKEINALPGDRAAKMTYYQRLVDAVLPATRYYPICENQIVSALLQIRRQIPVRVGEEELRRRFGVCPGVHGPGR